MPLDVYDLHGKTEQFLAITEPNAVDYREHQWATVGRWTVPCGGWWAVDIEVRSIKTGLSDAGLITAKGRSEVLSDGAASGAKARIAWLRQGALPNEKIFDLLAGQRIMVPPTTQVAIDVAAPDSGDGTPTIIAVKPNQNQITTSLSAGTIEDLVVGVSLASLTAPDDVQASELTYTVDVPAESFADITVQIPPFARTVQVFTTDPVLAQFPRWDDGNYVLPWTPQTLGTERTRIPGSAQVLTLRQNADDAVLPQRIVFGV